MIDILRDTLVRHEIIGIMIVLQEAKQHVDLEEKEDGEAA